MTKGLPKSLSRGAPQRQVIQKHVVQVKDLAMTVSGLTGVGFGTVPIGEFPEGNILFLGAAAYLQFSTASANVISTFDGDYSIGSAPTADASLDGAEVDIIPSTALGAATAKLSQVVRGVNAAQVMLDNTDNSLELNLNFLLDDASVSADANAFVVNGTVVLAYIVLADD